MDDPISLTPAQKAAILRDYERRLGECVPWSPSVDWQAELNFQAATYHVMDVIAGVTASEDPVEALTADRFVDSPSGRYRYCVRLHRRGRPLLTWWDSRVGTVIFDGDVRIPALFERAENGRWNESPWMSLTPAEFLTLRPGTKIAKGRVVIGGLGLGHQLIEVSRRLQVKHITLVEHSQELVDWLLPHIRPHVRKPLRVIVGDAYEVIPTLKGDVALLDMFPGYGNNGPAVAALARRTPGIKKFWGWGTAPMTGLGLRES